MNEKLENMEDKFINNVSRMGDVFGLNRFVLQLYGILYLSDKPMSLDDMVARLGVSKGNVSVNIRELEKWGAVRRVWVKGSRKDFYQADLDIKKVVINKIKAGADKRLTQLDSIINEFKSNLKTMETQLTGDDKKAVNIYNDRLKKIEDLKNMASGAMGLVGKFLG